LPKLYFLLVIGILIDWSGSKILINPTNSPIITLQATNKGKEEIKSLEKQMLKAHRKDVTSLIKGKKASGNLKDKEREIREKLVLKLKRKAESGVASQEGRVSKVGLVLPLFTGLCAT